MSSQLWHRLRRLIFNPGGSAYGRIPYRERQMEFNFQEENDRARFKKGQCMTAQVSSVTFSSNIRKALDKEG
jgi:hypothetical protein